MSLAETIYRSLVSTLPPAATRYAASPARRNETYLASAGDARIASASWTSSPATNPWQRWRLTRISRLTPTRGAICLRE